MAMAKKSNKQQTTKKVDRRGAAQRARRAKERLEKKLAASSTSSAPQINGDDTMHTHRAGANLKIFSPPSVVEQPPAMDPSGFAVETVNLQSTFTPNMNMSIGGIGGIGAVVTQPPREPNSVETVKQIFGYIGSLEEIIGKTHDTLFGPAPMGGALAKSDQGLSGDLRAISARLAMLVGAASTIHNRLVE